MTADIVEITAAPSRLDRTVEQLRTDTATITDVRAVLHLLARDDIDPVRAQGLLELANTALARFSADVRCAPPAALNDVVRVFATADCKAAHTGCDVEIPEWASDNGYCSRGCLVADMRSQGETWSDR